MNIHCIWLSLFLFNQPQSKSFQLYVEIFPFKGDHCRKAKKGFLIQVKPVFLGISSSKKEWPIWMPKSIQKTMRKKLLLIYFKKPKLWELININNVDHCALIYGHCTSLILGELLEFRNTNSGKRRGTNFLSHSYHSLEIFFLILKWALVLLHRKILRPKAEVT